MRVYWVWSLATSMNLHKNMTFCSFWELWGHFLFLIDWEVVKSYHIIVEELSHHFNHFDWWYNLRSLISLVDFCDSAVWLGLAGKNNKAWIWCRKQRRKRFFSQLGWLDYLAIKCCSMNLSLWKLIDSDWYLLVLQPLLKKIFQKERKCV